MTVPSLLVAVDFSPASGIAVEAAQQMAKRLGCKVVLVHAELPDDPQGPSRTREAHELAAQALAEELAKGGIAAEVAFHEGTPADVILREAQRHDAALVVMGTSGAGGVKGWLLGSVAKEVLRKSPIPVLVTPARMRPGSATPGHVVVVAVDFSFASEAAYEAGLRLALDMKCTVRLVHVLDGMPYAMGEMPVAAMLQEEDAALGRLGVLASKGRAMHVGVVPALHWGHPATALLAEGRTSNAAFLVVGTHGRSRVMKFMLGSVAQALVQAADRPVLVVPDGSAGKRGSWWR